MSAYPLEEVINRWQVGKLTEEQAVGQILQLLHEQLERLEEVERRLKEVERGDERSVETPH